MYTPFIFLCLQTFFLWSIVVILHRAKRKITLIPLYAYISALTIFTHNFSDLGFAVIINDWFFLIASFSFFTTLMLSILYLYLFEGPRACRTAFWTILLSSFLYISIVFLTKFQTDATNWVIFNSERALYYFWSITAIITDILFLCTTWELLAKIKRIPLVFRIFLIMFAVLLLDTLIFTTGVFSRETFYLSMLKGNIGIRLALSAIGAPIITFFFKTEGFAEEIRNKPKNFWEILNFKSDLEIKISDLEETLKKMAEIEKKLKDSDEKYQMVLNGTGIGIWEWNIPKDIVTCSPKFYEMLGYSQKDLKNTTASIKTIIHPEEIDGLFAQAYKLFGAGEDYYNTQCRLKNKNGEYLWFDVYGMTKYDKNKKPLKMIGSIINISKRKIIETELKEKIDQLTKSNEIMIGRELKMIELKNELENLKNNQ